MLRIFFFFPSRYKFTINDVFAKAEHEGPLTLKVHSHRWLVSLKGQFLIYFGSLVVAFAASLLENFLDTAPGPLPCLHRYVLVYLMMMGSLLTFFAMFDVYILWNITDAYMFYWEYLVIMVSGIPLFTVTVISLQLGWRGPAHEYFWVSSCMIIFCATVILPVVATFYFYAIIRETKKRLGDSESAHSNSSTTDNLVFYRKVESYKDLPIHQLEASLVYFTFLTRSLFLLLLSPDSFYQVNLDMSVRETIFETIEAGNIDYTLFNAPQAHALGLLRFSVFPLWKGSKEFKQLLQQLEVKDLKELGPKTPRKNRSVEPMAIEENSV